MQGYLPFLLFILLSTSSFGQSAEHYTKVQIQLKNHSDLQDLADAGIAIDHIHKNGKNRVDFVVDQEDLERLNSLNLAYEVLLPDMSAHYATILTNEPSSLVSVDCGLNNFDFGSMGGYHTYSEVVAHIQKMEAEYPELVKVSSIGASLEGRTVYAIKISDNVSQDEAGEGVVFYDALTHAREPMGLESHLYYMWWLLENYDSDAEATYLIDHRQMYFVPVVNPDGYVYNEVNEPGGGGLWRKNRRDNGDNCFGVDLNRNYAYDWGNLAGASTDPCSNIYLGSAAFSEPETQNIRDYIEQIKPSIGFSCHTYGDVLLFPNFFLNDFPKYEKYADFTSELIPKDYKGYGTGSDMIGYSSSGNTRDYLQSNGIMAWVPEIGHSFWEPSSEICDRVQEFMPAMKYLSWVSGDYIAFHGYSLRQADQLWQGDSLELVVRVKNKGLSTTTSQVKIRASSPAAALSPLVTEVELGALAPEEVKEDSSIPLQFLIDRELALGEEIPIDITILQDGVVSAHKRLNFYAGVRTVLFTEDGETDLDAWQTSANNWSITNQDSYNGQYCVSDSELGSYGPDQEALITSDWIGLPSFSNPFLEFKAKWALERTDDPVSVLIQTSGSSWMPLEGKYSITSPDNNLPIYANNQYWVEERIDLSAYTDADKFRIRFVIRTDQGIHSDGFYFDDLQVVDYQEKINVGTENTPLIASRINVFPNPGNGQKTLEILTTQKEQALLQINDPSGQLIQEERLSLQAGKNVFSIDLPQAGLFFLQIEREGSTETLRLINL